MYVNALKGKVLTILTLTILSYCKNLKKQSHSIERGNPQTTEVALFQKIRFKSE